MSRISDTPPARLRAGRGQVLVRISSAASELIGARAGWQCVGLRRASLLCVRAGLMGQASRKHPLPRGKRIALQRLAAQITARMLEAVEC